MRFTFSLTEVAAVAAALGRGFTFLPITEVGELLQAVNPFAGSEGKERFATALGSVESGGNARPAATGTPPSSVAESTVALKGLNARGFIPIVSFVLAAAVCVAGSFVVRILGTHFDAIDAGRLSIRDWLPQLKGMAVTRVCHFFLGGHHLEMVEVGRLLATAGLADRTIDAGLSWGARASAHGTAITAAWRRARHKS